jgi:hypothetical protein
LGSGRRGSHEAWTREETAENAGWRREVG